MSTVYGVNATKNNTAGPRNAIDNPGYGGRVRWMHDSYECVATASGTDIILGQKIPKGAHILPESKIYHDALGSANITVGTTAAGVDLSPAEDVSSAGTVELGNTVDLFGTALTGDSNIHVTPDAALTGTIRLSLLYSFR